MIIFISIFVSMAICYLIARFAKNMVVVALLVIVFQFGGFILAVETGDMFNSYSILNLAIVTCLTFVWFLVASQMHFWIKSKDPLGEFNKSKGLENG